MKFPTIKECITGSVTLVYVDKQEIWYKCENGFVFPIPIADWDGAIFYPKDKGIFFMRWVRKHLKTAIEAYKLQETTAGECEGSTLGS